MPNIAKKQKVVQEIHDKVVNAKSVVLVDSRGLTVLQDTQLRRVLREAGIDYKVYKNTMINFAIKDTHSEGLSPYLEGPTAVAFSYDEATKAANLINKQLKDMPNLEFKAGVVEGVLYDAKGMIAVADIPSREVLLSRLLGSLQSPVSSFARVLNALAEEKEKDSDDAKSTGSAEPAASAAPEEVPVVKAPEAAPVAEEAPEAVPAPEAAEEAPEATPAPEAAEEAPEATPAPEVAKEASEATPVAEEAEKTPEAVPAPEAAEETPEATPVAEAAEKAPAEAPAAKAPKKAPKAKAPKKAPATAVEVTEETETKEETES